MDSNIASYAGRSIAAQKGTTGPETYRDLGWHAYRGMDEMETCTMVDIKALVPWRSNKSQAPAQRDDFFDPFVTFRREMDRMFEDFFGGGSLRPAQTGWQGLTPAVGIEETSEELLISAELPGVSDKDVEVSLAGDILTIKGEKRAEQEKANGDSYYMERRFGSFSRSVRLPFDVQDRDVDAKFKDGVLTIRLPKPAEMQKAARRIEVKAL
jgi:HSP20 family protein